VPEIVIVLDTSALFFGLVIEMLGGMFG